MPQPLSKVVKNPPQEGVAISTQPGNAAKQPELAALVAQAISIWSLVDCTLGQILVDILGAKAAPGIAIYEAISSSANQVAALEAAAKIELTADNYKLLEALLRIYRRDAKQRHKFAHWIWAFCELAPEYLVLVEPARLIDGHTVATQLIHKQITDLAETKFKIAWSDEWYAYSRDEVERIVKQFSEVLNLFRWFQSLVRQHPAAAVIRAQALAYLNSHKQVLEALHLAQAKKGDGSDPEYNI